MGVFDATLQAPGSTEQQNAHVVTFHNANPRLRCEAAPTDLARAGAGSGDPQSLDPNKTMKPMAVWESGMPARKRKVQRSDKMLIW